MPAAIVIGDLETARAALRAAATLDRDVVLVSREGAISSLGLLGFVKTVEIARADVPAARAEAWIDCGSDSGRALAALEAGIDVIVHDLDERAVGALCSIADRRGRRVREDRPNAIDPASDRSPELAVRSWIASGGLSTDPLQMIPEGDRP